MEWNPVKKVLPENPGYYLICCKNGYITGVHYWNGYWNAFQDCTENSFNNVVAWMPMPEPYREENDEEGISI